MTTSRKAKVLVVDDHPLLREGLVQLINRQPDLACCGEAADIPSTLAAIQANCPEILVLDLRLKDEDGLELIKNLQATHPEIKILVLSQFDESVYALRALRAGARGYVMKEEASNRIIGAIQDVLNGRLVVSDFIQERVLRNAVEAKAEPGPRWVDRLTDRELQVLQAIGEGLPNRDIAQKYHLSPKTVETYRENLKAKLNLSDAKALLEFARQWIQNPSP